MTCERCHQDTRITTGSYFNTQIICEKCREKESQHVLYETARRIENEAVLNGNMNFPGIGLPSDLR